MPNRSNSMQVFQDVMLIIVDRLGVGISKASYLLRIQLPQGFHYGSDVPSEERDEVYAEALTAILENAAKAKEASENENSICASRETT